VAGVVIVHSCLAGWRCNVFKASELHADCEEQIYERCDLSRSFNNKMAEFAFRVPLCAAFQYVLDKSHSREQAILAAVKVLMEREPFDILNQEDAAFIAKTFGLFTNCKKIVGDVLWEAEQYNNATPLKDRAFLTEMASRLSQQEATSPDIP